MVITVIRPAVEKEYKYEQKGLNHVTNFLRITSRAGENNLHDESTGLLRTGSDRSGNSTHPEGASGGGGNSCNPHHYLRDRPPHSERRIPCQAGLDHRP